MSTLVSQEARTAGRLLTYLGRRTYGVARSYPFTSVLLVAMLAVSGVVDVLWPALSPGHPTGSSMSFGLPALREGHWWTYVVGALVVPSAALLPVAGALLALGVGALEHRVGSLRAGLALVATHLVGTVGASLFLWAASTTGWPWADGLARLSDTGPSAGGLGVLAVVTAFLQPPMRRAVRIGVGGYLVVTLMRSGLLWDLEHLLAFGTGLAVGPRFAGRPVAPLRWFVSKLAAVRGSAALLLAVTAVTELVEVHFPGYGGPLGAGPVVDPSAPALATAVTFLALALPVAEGLRRGSSLAWQVVAVAAVGLLTAHLLDVVTLTAGDVAVTSVLLALGVAHHELTASPLRAPAPVTDMEGRVRTHGGGSLGWQHTWPGSRSWTTADGAVALTYRRSCGVAIVVGDPVGPKAQWAAAVREFRGFCERTGLTPAWYAVSDDFVDGSSRHGWSTLQIGEDTVITLAGLEFRGRAWQDVRTARNRAAREGIVLRTVQLREAPPTLLAQVQEISDAWVGEKPLPEMGFTLGGVAEALEPQVRTHVAVDADGRVHGVTTWMPVHRDGAVVGWTLDLMRRRSDGFRPVMEFLIAESAMLFQAEGYESVSLSVAPLARRTAAGGRLLDRTLDTASQVLEPTYGFRSLLGFKAKFDPAYRPVHLAYASALDLPLIALAIGHAYLPDLTPVQLAHLAGEVARPLRARTARLVATVAAALERRPATRRAASTETACALG